MKIPMPNPSIFPIFTTLKSKKGRTNRKIKRDETKVINNLAMKYFFFISPQATKSHIFVSLPAQWAVRITIILPIHSKSFMLQKVSV